MRRRALLATGGALLGSALAGCLGVEDESTTTTSEQSTTERFTTTYAGTDDDLADTTHHSADTTDDSAGSTDEVDVSLSAEVDRLQPSVVLLGIDSIGASGADQQYLFYEVEVTDGEPPERLDFGFRYGGDIFSPGVDTGGQLWRASETEDRYTAERGSGWLVFELPPQRSASHAALSLGGDEWPVGDAVRERLEAPAPELTLEWNVDEEQTPGETPMTFTVTNNGNLDTRFVAGLNETGIRTAYSPIEAFTRLIPAGETVTWETTHENGVSPDSDTLDGSGTDGTYTLDWTGGHLERDVRFVSESNTESSLANV